jgi:hypothetical protein
MNAEQFFNNGFGADVEKVHRKHVIDLMTNFAKHYHTEQCNIADVVGRSEQLVCDCTNTQVCKVCAESKNIDWDDEWDEN